jgi:hypothetical protein
MDTVSTRPRRPDDAGIVDQVVAAMADTPVMATYDRTLKALAEHLQSDDRGFELLSDYESAVIDRVELAVRLSYQKSVLPHAFGGPDLTAIEEEFDRCWKLVRAMLGTDHLREVNDLLNAADARAVEAYDAGMCRGIGQLANPNSIGEMDPGELLGELADAVAVIGRHLHDLGSRV